MNFIQKLKFLFSKDAFDGLQLGEFADKNKNLLIIVCDPASDRMFVSFKKKTVYGRIKSAEGKQTHVVRDVLKYSKFDQSIGQFIASIVDTLQLPVWKGGANQFYQFIDGAVFNIARSLKKSGR